MHQYQHSLHKDKLTIVQLTDLHLFADDSMTMFGVHTNNQFYQVIETIKSDDQIKPDLFLLTGDLSQDESEASYEKITATLAPLNVPFYWIAGNHDNIEIMTRVFSKSEFFHHVRELSLKFFNLIFINTKLENSDEGYLSKTELDTLQYQLNMTPLNKSIIIVMHHHPLKTNTPLIDAFILKNAEEFWKIINQYPQIKLIICGHVHRDYRIVSGKVALESAPATCLQWEKGATTLSIDHQVGYKIYTLHNASYTSESRLWNILSID